MFIQRSFRYSLRLVFSFTILFLPSPSTSSTPQLVVTEIMQNPGMVSDYDGEWFELYNADSLSFDLRGWTILDSGTDSHVIEADEPVIIEPGQYFVFGRKKNSAVNGGVEVNYEYSSFILGNSDDEIIILDANSMEVDRIEYDGGPNFPDPEGVSIVLLDPMFDNNVGSNWIESLVFYGDGDLGTPGSFNFPYFGPVWHVTNSGSDSTGDGSEENPFFSIQKGINSSNDGDTVLAHPGIYRENISFQGKTLVLGSLFLVDHDTSYISRTIIDGDSKNSVVTISEEEDSTTTLAGLTIINGFADQGGGIYINNSSPTISNCTIKDNRASHYGGGFYIQEANPVISHCFISDNRITEGVAPSFLGAGVYSLNSNLWIKRCVLSGNRGSIAGAFACDHSNLTVTQCTVSQNEGFTAGGIYALNGSNLRVVNSVFWGNLPGEFSFATYGDSNSVTVSFSDLSFGTDSSISGGNGSVNWLDGNLAIDPLFLDPGNGNFRLQDESPCIDTGTPLFVLNGDTIVNISTDVYIGSAPDMGAHEFGVIAVKQTGEYFPSDFTLYQNFPNPFNSTTRIIYDLPVRSQVSLFIFDLLGQQIRKLIQEHEEPGKKSVVWDGTDDRGVSVSTGIYIYSISIRPVYRQKKEQAIRFNQANKIILLK